MIGLVLVTHGGLAKEFQLALEHVVGPQAQVETVSIGPDDDMDASLEAATESGKRYINVASQVLAGQ